MRHHLFAAALLYAGAAHAASPATSTYVATAGASDLYEKMSSEIVLKGASTDAVRSFATMMISDHSKTTQQVKAAATSAGVKVDPPQLMPKQQAMIDALKSASGSAREKLYVQQQMMAHQEALALHSGYARTGDTPELKKVAASAVPIIEQHLTMVKKLGAAK